MEAPHPFSYSTGDLYRDSSHTNTTYTTDFSASTGKPKPVAGADFYDRSYFSRRVALFGLFISFLVGIACIVCSVHVFLSKRTMLTGVAFLPLEQWWQRELVGLGATLLVALCTEATGFVHNVALRSALASEQRLRFNTNLRLLSAAKGALNPNGKMFNGLMALLLVVSYSSGILVTLAVVTDSSEGRTRAVPLPSTTQIYISNVALLVLGGALLLQVVIAVVAMATADIRTWSSSPFDITAALVHHTQVTPLQGRCMHGVKDVDIHVPLLPRKKQPSAWRSHSSLRKVIITIWVLMLACIAWAFVVTHISAGNIRNVFTSWSFFSGQRSDVAGYHISLLGKTAWVDWVVCYLSTMAVQGWVTLTLHCSELVANVIRDEKVWRCATEMKGAKVLTHPLAPVLGSWLSLTLLCAKALLHWMLGLAISLQGTASAGVLTSISVSMYPVQIFNLAAALFVLSLIFTATAFYSPKGPQPAAYGHVQTLANLIDEWSPVMWWGDKPAPGGSSFRHAGTNDSPLPPVWMNEKYA